MTAGMAAELNRALAGRYRIERRIGRGGMAEVYLAEDLRHRRRVAVKVLSSELGAALGADRFLTEIRVTANLQHPNLLPLFDSGEAHGQLFYVTPFVPGESLRTKLEREKQLPIDEAIHIATGVAAALDYAHRQGVVHRDLKPENVLLHDGQPIVADFGIALAMSRAGEGRTTLTGVTLGTPQYMSPEQATGDRSLDARTDVYSLGALLYEMLTGDPPHSASTAQATIAKVLTETPCDVMVSRPSVPRHVALAVKRALEKLPADRWHSAHEFAVAISDREAAVVMQAAAPTMHGAVSGEDRRRQLWMAMGLIVGISLAALIGWLDGQRRESASASFVVEPPTINGARSHIGDVAMAPDGQAVAFVSSLDTVSQVYVRRLDNTEASVVPGLGAARWVSYSPDGQYLAVGTRDNRLLRVALKDGAIVTLAEGFTNGGQRGPAAWASDNSLIVGTWGANDIGLFRVRPTDRAITQLTKPESAFAHGLPTLTRDGQTLLFEDWGPGFSEDDFLAIGSPETGEYQRTAIQSYRPVGVAEGHIVYETAGGAIMAVPFDERVKRVTGQATRLLEGRTEGYGAGSSLSPNGTLAYKRGPVTHQLVLVDSAGHTSALSDDDHTFALEIGSGIRLSPDGRRLAVVLRSKHGDTLSSDIWMFDMRARTFRQVTSFGGATRPVWTPDGTQLIFTSWFQGVPRLWIQSADGAKPPVPLHDLPGGVLTAEAVLPDGSGVLICRNRWPRADLLLLKPVRDGRLSTLLNGACDAAVSPDGRWLAFADLTDIFVIPASGVGRRVRVSSDGGSSPRWGRDGSRLFYRAAMAGNGSAAIVGVRVRAGVSGIEVSRREVVARIPPSFVTIELEGGFDMMGDDRTSVQARESDSHVQLIVATNWVARLRALAR